VLAFQTPTGTPRRVDTGHCVGREFVRAADHLYVLTDCGIVRLTPDGVSGYIVDVTSDGRVRVVPGLP
jgi:hypothetical protein